MAQKEEKDVWITMEFLYNEFLKMSSMDKKEYSMKRFSKAIDESCTILKIAYQSTRSKEHSNRKCVKFVETNLVEQILE